MNNVVNFNDYKAGVVEGIVNTATTAYPDEVVVFDDPLEYLAVIEQFSEMLSIPYPLLLTGIHNNMVSLVEFLGGELQEENIRNLLVCMDRVATLEGELTRMGVEVEVEIVNEEIESEIEDDDDKEIQ